ncbi:hypothetical protein PMIN01_09463 [Paraphaeosphaeria minitans]|uniref:Uncharacterized protein n=1 Tax=Paraphaeosphaeria minitans TaxID=565426 RepID=A0A9P6GE04_9PLEO|nr:hypothetical protein PMIN01_09463 [Paraphaeosphaeria minitans]
MTSRRCFDSACFTARELPRSLVSWLVARRASLTARRKDAGQVDAEDVYVASGFGIQILGEAALGREIRAPSAMCIGGDGAVRSGSASRPSDGPQVIRDISLGDEARDEEIRDADGDRTGGSIIKSEEKSEEEVVE